MHTPLALHNASHSSQGSSTLMDLVTLIQYLIHLFYKVFKVCAQIKLILTPSWLLWILLLPANLTTCITNFFWTILGFSNQTKHLWETIQLLPWSFTIASSLICFPKILEHQWSRWAALVYLQDKVGRLGKIVGLWTRRLLCFCNVNLFYNAVRMKCSFVANCKWLEYDA